MKGRLTGQGGYGISKKNSIFFSGIMFPFTLPFIVCIKSTQAVTCFSRYIMYKWSFAILFLLSALCCSHLCHCFKWFPSSASFWCFS